MVCTVKETALLAGKITREPAGDLWRTDLILNCKYKNAKEKVKMADLTLVLITIFHFISFKYLISGMFTMFTS